MARKIYLTNATYLLLEAHTTTGRFRPSDARRLPSGIWEVEVDDDTADALALVDPDPNAAIRRVLGGGVGHA